mgnify:CR=1 FL=1
MNGAYSLNQEQGLQTCYVILFVIRACTCVVQLTYSRAFMLLMVVCLLPHFSHLLCTHTPF